MWVVTRLVIVLAMLTFAEFAQASDWVFFDRFVRDNGVTEVVSLDIASVAPRGKGIKTIWIQHSYSEQIKTERQLAYRSYRSMFAFSCVARQMSLISTSFYSGENGQGNSFGATNYKDWDMDWNEITPDSVAERVLKFVCDGVGISSR